VPPTSASGAEAIYSFDVPPDTIADLILTTDIAETGGTDTFVYLRAACPDPDTELACNDDRVAGELQSDLTVLDLSEGRYFVFVEVYDGVPSGTAPHGLQVILRPVLSPGAACDITGNASRCADGACATVAGGDFCP
jgi:hypothetical protein